MTQSINGVINDDGVSGWVVVGGGGRGQLGLQFSYITERREREAVE